MGQMLGQLQGGGAAVDGNRVPILHHGRRRLGNRPLFIDALHQFFIECRFIVSLSVADSPAMGPLQKPGKFQLPQIVADGRRGYFKFVAELRHRGLYLLVDQLHNQMLAFLREYAFLISSAQINGSSDSFFSCIVSSNPSFLSPFAAWAKSASLPSL